VAVYGLRTSQRAESKHRILLELGQGGTANVFLAVVKGLTGFNKLVVLKALKPHLANDPDFRAMFLNEARIAARLNHPNVIQTNEVIEDRGLPIIVMEYLEGQPLSNVLTRAAGGGSSMAVHLKILLDALAGLQYAHELVDFDGTPLGLVHRDMTPHNVFVTFEGQVKILDFGIAKLSTSHVETQTGVMKGKLRYMPPEQIAGDDVDRRADIFAVGVTLWEILTGEKMWKGLPDTVIMNRVLNGEIPSPSSTGVAVPAQLERICLKALSPDREARYATAAELESELDEALTQLGLSLSNKQVAKIVSRMFDDVRRETKSLIESQLSKATRISWADYLAAPLLPAPTDTSTSKRSRLDGFAVTDRSSAPPQRPHWKAYAGAGAALAAAVTALLFVGKPAPSAPTGPIEPSQSTTAQLSAPPHDPPIVPPTPVMDRDAEVFTAIEPAIPIKKRPASRTGAVASSAPTLPLPKTTCSPPYFIDDRGIKKFKPECM
jgi:serine/threonine protein kinase